MTARFQRLRQCIQDRFGLITAAQGLQRQAVVVAAVGEVGMLGVPGLDAGLLAEATGLHQCLGFFQQGRIDFKSANPGAGIAHEAARRAATASAYEQHA